MMERRFDMIDFEQSLRDHADQFTMVPSKRVWKGIYNNLHPGSKWPSITVGIILLITLVGIGYFNNSPLKIANNSVKRTERNSSIKREVQNSTSSLRISAFDKSAAATLHSSNIESQTAATLQTNDFIEKDFFSTDSKAIKHYSRQTAAIPQASGFVVQKKIENENSDVVLNKTGADLVENNPVELNLAQIRSDKSDINSLNNNLEKTQSEIKNDINGLVKNDQPRFTIDNFTSPEFMILLSLSQIPPSVINDISKEVIQNNHNTTIDKQGKTANIKTPRIHKRRNPNINWVYYVTPTASSVTFRGRAIPQSTIGQNLSPIVVLSNQQSGKMLYNARLGYQFGTEMTYSLSKKMQFFTGIKLSYSGYNITSNQVHPTLAYLMLKDENYGNAYAKSYITHYGNGQGQNQISLSNRSLQLSIPLGLQYNLWKNNNVRINIASSLEPSIVLKSNSYIISDDRRNYISDPELLRKLNVAGNFGSYVSFSFKKIKWQVGPSVRYQLFSTYQNIYPVKEHLIDYGIRIGISR
ncbi:MAG: PorT family protein [Bacteroidota bacterium]|nr:PorT family protein [Bacteroidota bacterium]